MGKREIVKEAARKAKAIRTQGRVTEALGGDRFRVVLDNGVTILATLSGRLLQKHIRVIPGDRVDVDMSPYDLTHGRIAWRYNVKES